MKKTFIGLLLAGVAGFSSVTTACMSDFDCDYGSKCIKQNALNGYCAGGMNPGNSSDRKPYRDRLSPGVGMSCSYNGDCESGQRCRKSGLQGVCVDR